MERFTVKASAVLTATILTLKVEPAGCPPLGVPVPIAGEADAAIASKARDAAWSPDWSHLSGEDRAAVAYAVGRVVGDVLQQKNTNELPRAENVGGGWYAEYETGDESAVAGVDVDLMVPPAGEPIAELAKFYQGECYEIHVGDKLQMWDGQWFGVATWDPGTGSFGLVMEGGTGESLANPVSDVLEGVVHIERRGEVVYRKTTQPAEEPASTGGSDAPTVAAPEAVGSSGS